MKNKKNQKGGDMPMEEPFEAPWQAKLYPKQKNLDQYPKERKTYPQKWPQYNEAQTKEGYLFTKLLISLLDEVLEVPGHIPRRGRPRTSLRDMIICLTMKVYYGRSSRRLISHLNYLKAVDFIEKVPHFNTLLKYLDEKELTDLLKHLIEQSGVPLAQVEENFACDASGFACSIFDRWLDHRGKSNRKRMFKKCHLMTGVKTKVITGIRITDGHCADSPYFKELLEKTVKRFKIREVSADPAYSSRANLQAVHENGGIPFILFKENTNVDKVTDTPIWNAMTRYFHKHKEKFMESYHKRSNVESVFSMIKRKFSVNLMCGRESAQINEILLKALCHNICVLIHEMFELGIIVDFERCEKYKLAAVQTS